MEKIQDPSNISNVSSAVNIPMGITSRLHQDRAIQIGDKVALISIETFRKFFSGLSLNAAIRILNMFQIPLIYIGDMGYFNKYTLETVLEYMTRPNRKGFAMPGSTRKKQIHKKGPSKFVDTSLSEKDKEELKKLKTSTGKATGKTNGKSAGKSRRRKSGSTANISDS